METAALGTCLATWRVDAQTVVTLARRLAEQARVDDERQFLLGAALIALVGRFQQTCRDLILTAISIICAHAGRDLGALLEQALPTGLRIERGNATTSTLSADLERFGIGFRDALTQQALDPHSVQTRLDAIHAVRNALAHGDAAPRPLDLAGLDEASTVLDAIASAIEAALRERLSRITRGIGGE